MHTVLEVLQYTLKEGAGIQFHCVMLTQSIPLHKKCGLKVVAYGNSLDNPDKYLLIRAFPDTEKMEKELEVFYSDEQWHNGPRTAILSMIEQSHRVLLNESVFLSNSLQF